MTISNHPKQEQNKANENVITELAEVIQLHKAGFKLLPLSINNEVTIPWTPIYDNPDYWTEEKLVKEQSMFSNVATVFGSINFQDEKGQILFLNCLDCDSEYVYKILVTPINQLQISQKLYSRIQNLLINLNTTTLLEFLKQFTYIVKTRKPYGIHIYWLSWDQNNRIRTEDCKGGFEFEVKTDKGSGHSTLPPSRHRNDIDFRYHNIGRSDKIGISNELYQIFVELFSSCLHECHFNNRDVEANSKCSYNYYGIDNTLTLRSDQVNDSITLLQNCYQEGHRDTFSFQFGGLAFKQCIAEESAIAIIKGLCNYTNDPEINGRICVIQNTYSKGVNGSDISGRSGLIALIVSLDLYNEEEAKRVIQSLVDIWERYEILLNNIILDKVCFLTNEHLDKIKKVTGYRILFRYYSKGSTK